MLSLEQLYALLVRSGADLYGPLSALDLSGFRQARGWPVGQTADYKGLVFRPNGYPSCVHVRAYGSTFEAHIDRFDASVHPILHFLFDVIPWLLGFGVR